jgi:hypothetical protein
MYSWMWHQLPGPALLRALIALAVLFAVILICFEWVFPAVAPYMPFNDSTVGD